VEFSRRIQPFRGHTAATVSTSTLDAIQLKEQALDQATASGAVKIDGKKEALLVLAVVPLPAHVGEVVAVNRSIP
jgi:hypothetical protein